MAKKIINTEFHFRELSRGEGTKENDRYGAFATEDKDIVDTFAREFCQNLKDATRDGEIGRVSFRILETKDYDYKYLQKIISPLETPLEVKLSDLSSRILVIEEEGTSGLGGSINIDDANSDHNNFWLNSGRRIGKGKIANVKKSGSAGKGNITYFLASETKTVLAYTNREDAKSHQEYVMGKCELRTGWEEKKGGNIIRRNYEGFYCDQSKDGDNIPLDGSGEIDAFFKAFDLKRGKGELGTSFVIPFLKESFTEEEILKSVVREYFFLILKGEIEISVCGETIDRNSIEDIANKYLTEGKEYRDFLMEVETLPTSEKIEVDNTWFENLTDDSFNDVALLEAAKKRFSENKLICTKVPIEITRQDNSKHQGFFSFYCKKGSNKEDSRIMRSGIPITQEPYRASKVNVPFFSLLYIDADEVGSFCKAAETPNHIRFDKSMDSIKELYKDSAPLTLIRNASYIFGNYFLGIEDELNKDKLASIVSIKVLTPPKPNKGNRKKITRKKKKKPYTPTIRHNYFSMSSGNGWRMDPGPDPISAFPFKLNIEFSIAQVDTPHNKRINSSTYDPNDFDLGDNSGWQMNSNDINIISKNYNILEVEIIGPKFWIDVIHPVFDNNPIHSNLIWN